MRAERISRLIDALSAGLYQRDEVLRLTLLGVLSGENVFLYGPTGSAKGLLARRVAQVLSRSRDFSYVLSRQTGPDELFGPISVTKLRDYDLYERIVQGYLPDSEIAFIDNIWNAEGFVRNALSLALDERVFRNGTNTVTIPLISCLGSDTSLPSASSFAETLSDHFVLRVSVDPVSEKDAFTALITDTTPTNASVVPEELRLTAAELVAWRDEARSVEVTDEIAELIFDVRERILRHNLHHRTEGQSEIIVSDRRWKRAMNVLRTSAYINDRTQVDAIDVILLRHCLWTRQDQVEPVNTIVSEAIRRFVASGRFDPDVMRERLHQLTSELRSEVVATEEAIVEQPVIYRDEYYRLNDFPAESEVLIWISDFEQLLPSKEIETDLFFHGEEDDYAYSERVMARKVTGTEIEIDGERKTIETEPTRTAVERSLELEPAVRDEWMARITELDNAIDETIGDIIQYRDSSSGEAVEHLFVHREYANIVIDGMNEAASTFAELKTEIESTRSRVGE